MNLHQLSYVLLSYVLLEKNVNMIYAPIIRISKSDNAFPWLSAHISIFTIGAPTEYAHSTLHVSDHLPHTNM